MKLLMLEWYLSSQRGGMELAMFEECVQLRARGHDVWIGYNEPGDLLDRYVSAGVKPIHLPTYNPVRKHLLRDAGWTAQALARTISLPVDVVVANSYQSTFFGAVLSRAKGVPFACHLRLLPPDKQTAPARFGLTQVTHFIAVSEAVRSDWIERGVPPGAISVAHDGIDLGRFKPLSDREILRSALALRPDDFAVILCCRLDPGKNVEGALEAFARLSRDVPQARLLIAGRPVDQLPERGEYYLQSLRQLAGELDIEDRVTWLGHRRDMPELYNAADAVVLFGRIPEPFGLVTCEALACGRPMVTPRQGGSLEILTGEFSNLMFDPSRPDEAAAILRSLVSWQERDPGFASRARAHVAANFDIRLVGQRMEAELARVVSGPPTRTGFRLQPLIPDVQLRTDKDALLSASDDGAKSTSLTA